MTAVHPRRTRAEEDHLVAFAAGYLAASATADRDAYQAGHADGYAAGYLQVLRDIAAGVLADPDNLVRHLIAVGRADSLATARGLARRRTERADMERRAAERIAAGGTEYRGGAVTWEPEVAA